MYDKNIIKKKLGSKGSLNLQIFIILLLDRKVSKSKEKLCSSVQTLDGIKRGATLDFLLHISAHILVIIGFFGLGQKAKSCTSACYLCFLLLT